MLNNSFLYRIANAYYQHYESGISDFTFIFPNRRAGVFFEKFLSEISGKTIFSPEILTIESCFFHASEIKEIDRISLLIQLYQTYKEISGSTESFDDFAFWGEMLLSDFNEIDTYKVDAKQLFVNIKDLKDIDNNYDYITENQLNAINEFWGSFIKSNWSKSRTDFLELWEILLPVYEKLKDELLSEKTAWKGLIFRDITERLEKGEKFDFFENKKFVFVGFNALNPCEKSLFLSLNKYYETDFYWDYDSIELQDNDNPASLYKNENLSLFKSRLNIEKHDIPLKSKKIHLFNIPSSVGQSKYVNKILEDLYGDEINDKEFLETAVVLPDENLLLPVLYSLPPGISNVNVTMGYPLNLTPVAGLIEQIFDLRKKIRKHDFYHLSVLNILNQQFIHDIVDENVIKNLKNKINLKNLIYISENEFSNDPILKTIFRSELKAGCFSEYLLEILNLFFSNLFTDNQKDTTLEQAFLFQYITTVKRINEIFRTKLRDETMLPETEIKIIKKLTSGISVPFEGEPVNGLQIMGMLETRGLDFKNLIITSFNEGVFPANRNQETFIPFQLRKAYGLPTFELLDAITSYNFYRLIQRAENIFFISDSRNENGQSSELSRFYHQLKYLYKVDFIIEEIKYEVQLSQNEEIVINKTKQIQEKLFKYKEGNELALSASSIKNYLDCPLKFYFSEIEKIREQDVVTDDIENNVFGNIFHDVISGIYKPYKNRLIDADVVDKFIKDKDTTYKLTLDAFNKYFFKNTGDKYIPELKGNNLLISKIIEKYIEGVLLFDKKNTPFRYISGEERIYSYIDTKFGKINLKGIIDRIDERNDVLHILDYKTGKAENEFADMETIFNTEISVEKRSAYVFQILFYCYLYHKQFKSEKTIKPGIIKVKNIYQADFDFQVKEKSNNLLVIDYRDYEYEFVNLLKLCIETIFDPAISFGQTKNLDNCKYCSYKVLCNKQ